jgi:hypothetical protein
MNKNLIVLSLVTFAVWLPCAHAQMAKQTQEISLAQQRWAELGAISFKYRLKVGGVFGAGVYRVEVVNGRCVSKHIGGIGMGAAHFRDHFHTEPNCDGRLISDLVNEVQGDIGRGYDLQDLKIDAKFGFLTRAYLDTAQLFDQGWGFEVTDFKLLSAKPQRTGS